MLELLVELLVVDVDVDVHVVLLVALDLHNRLERVQVAVGKEPQIVVDKRRHRLARRHDRLEQELGARHLLAHQLGVGGGRFSRGHCQ